MRPRPTRPPVARRVPAERRVHGEVVVDHYSWLRRRDDPAVLAHLEAENAWTEAELDHLGPLRERLFAEIRGRVQETDLSVPFRKGAWWYHSRTEEGRQYAIHGRRAGAPSEAGPSPGAPEQVMLDENALAEGHHFLALGALDVSPDGSLLAYSTDLEGGERFALRIRDLDGGRDLPEEMAGTYYGTAWSADGTTLFYVRPDPAMRPYQLWRHRVGTSPDEDELVYAEDDERFHLGVHLTKDERFVVLHLGSRITDEVRVLDASDPAGAFRTIEPRRQGVEYRLDHHGQRFLIVTNVDGAENFALMEAPEDDPGRHRWKEVLGHRPDVTLLGVDVLAEHLVVFERAAGVRRLRLMDLSSGTDRVLDQPEEVSTTHGGDNPELRTSSLRYRYTSMVTPPSVYDLDLRTGERTLKKRQPVLGGYDPADYATERLWARAEDGVEVPISVVYRKGLRRDGSAPALLYGYGSYEASMDPRFSSARLSLLDRGFLYAVAHVRGGGELGRRWYLDGKELRKRNTFADFVACARHLVDEGWTAPARLAIRGGSAGGLLVGAALNLAPELFGAAVAEVPFVDALNTILDPSLPLTVIEWEEWGNPVVSAEVYRYMRSYAPYENVSAREYPPILATAGLSDPRVSYWEPAKWVAQMRATATGSSRLLLRTEMGQGHMGPTGRYDAWREEALVQAFVIDALGVEEADSPEVPQGAKRP